MTEAQWNGRLIAYTRSLAEHALSESAFDEFADLLHRDQQGQVGILEYDSKGSLLATPVARGSWVEVQREYASYYHAENPFPRIVEENNLSNSTSIMGRYLPLNRLRKTEYYADFMRPISAAYALGMSIRMPDGGRVAFSMYRGDRDGGEFTDVEARRIDMLRPYVKQAVMLRQMFKQRTGSTESIPAAAESLDEPAILILTDESVRPLNDAGERYLSRRRSRRLPLDPGMGQRRGECGFVAAQDLPPGSGFPNRSVIAIGSAASRQLLQKVFSLTPREAEVAIELVEGWSNREVASRLGMSLETCRTHVKAIHLKSGVSSTRRFIRIANDLL
jgi:DNA-binding CsgD family transcriptional regulator